MGSAVCEKMIKQIKKVIPYTLILIIMIGFLGIANKTFAESPDDKGSCTRILGTGAAGTTETAHGKKRSECTGVNSNFKMYTPEYPAPANPSGEYVTTGIKEQPDTRSDFEKNLGDCGVIIDGTLDGCLLKIAYYIIYGIPAFLLAVSGYFFNAVVSLVLSSNLYSSDFISESWTIVRDLSNVFFILVLLYIAIQTILGIGGGGHGGGPKKMIAQVIIMALLINFSMFFTKVVIDSGNILALVFYNKLAVETTVNGAVQNYDSQRITDPGKIGVAERDISGAIVNAFNPTRLLTEDFFNTLKTKTQSVGLSMVGTAAWTAGGAYAGSLVFPIIGTAVGAGIGYGASKIVGWFVSTNEVPVGIMLSIIVISGLIMGFAAYAFFIAGLSFVGRLVELWVLIIFSPFAFMSSTLPILSHISDVGWDSWLKKLLQATFMAPIFMFFMYFIFKLVNSGIFGQIGRMEDKDRGTFEILILMIIPAIVILNLLMKATDYAKKGAGKAGEILTGAGKAAVTLAGGMAVGGGIGLAAKGLQGTLGHAGKALFENKTLTNMEVNGNWAKKRFARGLRSMGGGDDGKGGFAGSSFDLRKGIMGTGLKAITAATGVNLGTNSSFMMGEDGGYEADLKRKDAQRKKRAEGLAIKEWEAEKQTLNKYEEDHQQLSSDNNHDLHQVDLDLEGAKKKRETLEKIANSTINKKQNDDGTYQDPEYAQRLQDFQEASLAVQKLEAKRSGIKNGGEILNPDGTGTGTYRTNNGYISASEVKNTKEASDKAQTELTTARVNHDSAKASKEAAEAAEAAAKEIAKLAKEQLELTPTSSVAIENHKNATETLEKTKKERVTADRSFASTQSRLTKMETLARNFEDKVRVADAAVARAAADGKELGYSQNDYDDKLLPEQKHKVSDVTRARTWAYADQIEQQWGFPWDAAARKQSAHGIRMGAKADSHGGGHGKSSGASDLFAHALGSMAMGAVLHGGDSHGDAGHGDGGAHGDSHGPAH